MSLHQLNPTDGAIRYLDGPAGAGRRRQQQHGVITKKSPT